MPGHVVDELLGLGFLWFSVFCGHGDTSLRYIQLKSKRDSWMNRFTFAVANALDAENWYGALMIALTIPDVCGRLETPNDGVGKRYIRWYERFMQHKYAMNQQMGGHVFLGGADCYALRCSYLHEGSGDITGQRARSALERFHFISPPGQGNSFHNIQSGNVLLLQTDIFCRDMIDGVKQWERTIMENPVVAKQKLALLQIHDVSGGFTF